MNDIAQNWDLCLDAANAIYSNKKANPRYAFDVATQMLGTIYQESNGRTRRQFGLERVEYVGAFGITQIEWPTIKECLKRLDKKPAMAVRLARFVFERDGYDVCWYKHVTLWRREAILWTLQTSDRLAIALTRVNYSRFPPRIPEGADEQSRYWKAHWNTPRGKGTAHEYQDNWLRYCERFISELKAGRRE